MIAAIARLKITLDNVKPPVRRRIEVPLDIRLDRLHLAIQAAMGWSNVHLYEIRVRDVGWSDPDPEWGVDGPRDASKVRLANLLEEGIKTLKYVYDFGDGWAHTIKLERIVDAEPGIAYPRLVDAVGACPPEDCGGPWGYGDFLEAIADPAHERHDELVRWIGRDFDPGAVDAAALADAVAALANSWSRKSSARRRPRG
jgi:hypothetical protein